MSILDCIAPSFRPKVLEFIERQSAGETAPKFYEGRCQRTDGTEFDADFSVSTYEVDGEVYSVTRFAISPSENAPNKNCERAKRSFGRCLTAPATRCSYPKSAS